MTLYTRCFVALAVSAIFSVAHASYAQNASKQDAHISYVAAGITSARAKIRSFEATTTFYQYDPKEVNALFKDVFPDGSLKADVDVENRRLARFCVTDDKEKLSLTYITDESLPPNHTRYLLIEPDRVSMLDEDIDKKEDVIETKSYSGSIMSRETGLKGGIIGDVKECDPRRLGYPAGPGIFFDDLLRSKEVPLFYRGEVDMDGTPCYKIEMHVNPTDHRFYWLDKNHGFLVRRVDLLEKLANKWYTTQVIRTLRVQESNGVWLPAEVEMRVLFGLAPPYQAGGSKHGQLPRGIGRDKVQLIDGVLAVPGRFYRYTVENLRVNEPIAPKNLVWEWPPNSFVYDRITKKRVDTKPKESKSTTEKVAP